MTVAVNQNEATGSTARVAVQTADAPALLEYLSACPICNESELDHYCRVPSLFNPGEYIRYERCQDCGTVLRNPRLPPARRLDGYEDRIFPPEAKRVDPVRCRHYTYMMRLLARLLPASGSRRLLDFGCGAGEYLLAARAAGFDVTGLELNRDLAQHVSKTYGIPVVQGLIEEADFGDQPFDVIISSQVFEHLLSPRQTLRALGSYLVPSGFLLIEVPNLRDVRERMSRGATMDDSHLFYFDRWSLSRMLANEGFAVVSVHEGLRPYRFHEGAVYWPLWSLRALDRTLSFCRLTTGLSVIARRA